MASNVAAAQTSLTSTVRTPRHHSYDNDAAKQNKTGDELDELYTIDNNWVCVYPPHEHRELRLLAVHAHVRLVVRHPNGRMKSGRCFAALAQQIFYTLVDVRHPLLLLGVSGRIHGKRFRCGAD